MVQVEGIVNDRPLTKDPTLPADLAAQEPLRPRTMISPGFTGDVTRNFIADPPISEADMARTRFEAARARVRAFWAKWKDEYLITLANRSKWRKSQVNLKKGDLVQIVDETLDRSKWQLGMVEEVDNEDGHARKIHLRRANGKKIWRDRTKIVLLELDDGL